MHYLFQKFFCSEKKHYFTELVIEFAKIYIAKCSMHWCLYKKDIVKQWIRL